MWSLLTRIWESDLRQSYWGSAVNRLVRLLLRKSFGRPLPCTCRAPIIVLAFPPGLPWPRRPRPGSAGRPGPPTSRSRWSVPWFSGRFRTFIFLPLAHAAFRKRSNCRRGPNMRLITSGTRPWLWRGGSLARRSWWWFGVWARQSTAGTALPLLGRCRHRAPAPSRGACLGSISNSKLRPWWPA